MHESDETYDISLQYNSEILETPEWYYDIW